MKRFIVPLLLFLAAALLVPPAEAQVTANINGQQMYYIHPIYATRQYANSQSDTLPNYRTASGLKAGGAIMAGFKFVFQDSVAADLVVQYQIRGSTTWTQAYVDSLIQASSSGLKTEIVLRNNTLERMGVFDGNIRALLTFRASGNGNGGKPATKKYSADLVYR